MEDPIFTNGPEKIFVDEAKAQAVNGLLQFWLRSGTEKYTFLFHLATAKQIGRLLLKQVEEIEAKTGQKFDARLSNEPLMSPIQDIGDSDKKGPEKPKPKKR